MLHLDHIIVLLSHASLEDLPSWITDNFTISPGGRHADGKTENKLICFRDGSYIELIAFVNDDPKNREGHWWGPKQPGIIDFAFIDSSGDADIQYSELSTRLVKLNAEDGTININYAEPVAGGRKRPDGEDVKWKVTFPVLDDGRQRGELPFFCHDVTPRSLRVPLESQNVDHACGAYGVKELSIYFTSAKLETGLKAYPAVLGVENTAANVGKYSLKRLHEVDGAPDPSFRVQKPSDEAQVNAAEERHGALIGNLIIGCHDIRSKPREGVHEIDQGKASIGGIFLDFGN